MTHKILVNLNFAGIHQLLEIYWTLPENQPKEKRKVSGLDLDLDFEIKFDLFETPTESANMLIDYYIFIRTLQSQMSEIAIYISRQEAQVRLLQRPSLKRSHRRLRSSSRARCSRRWTCATRATSPASRFSATTSSKSAGFASPMSFDGESCI